MSKISYDQSKDVLIHVGDLIAKGDKNEEVMQWMMKHNIQGVRGNHDQPVREPYSAYRA
jgi:predicted phosphodiesterase